MPVGLITETEFHVIEREFAPGSRLCILTDGISETENAEEVEFGTTAIENLLRGDDPITTILEAVQVFYEHREAQDDRTLVVLERLI